MTVTINGTTGITNDGGYTGDGVVFADTTPANTLVTTTGGNVGIGTSSPSTYGQVAVYRNTTDGTNANVAAVNAGTTASYAGFQATAGTVNWQVFSDAAGNAIGTAGAMIRTISNHPMLFGTNNTERVRIDSSGNLLVGTTTSGGVGFTVGVDGAGRILTSNVSAVPFDVYFFKNGGTTVGKITINTSSTSYTTTSDYRLKEDVQPMTGALAKVAALKPVTYTWKSTGETDEGFIAHELAEVAPQCVTGEKDAVDADGNPQYQGIDTSFLIATLTAAIQELKALNDAQAQTITALTARVTALEGQP